jgi:putative ABC transport system permease protein
MRVIRRDARRVNVVDDVARDVRCATRMLRRSPGASVITILSLALGIGATTAMFSLIDALVFTKLPVARPDELVMFREHLPPYRSRTDFPDGEFVRFRDETPMFSSLSAINVIDRWTDEY